MIAELKYRVADGTAVVWDTIDIEEDMNFHFNKNNTFFFKVPKPRDRTSEYGRAFKADSRYMLVEEDKGKLKLYEDGKDITDDFDYMGLFIYYTSEWKRYGR